MLETNTKPTLRRHPGDLLRLALGTTITVGSMLLAYHGEAGKLETDIFRIINDLPAVFSGPLRVIQETGSYAAVLAAAGLAIATRRSRLARDLAVSGTAAYLLAKALKAVIVRGRPALLLSNVLIRGAEATGLGFPSGHAAVASALATAVCPYLGQRTRRVVWGIVWLVAVARVYVGAHLPVDVVAGVALGWAVGAAVHLLWGAPGGWPSVEVVQKALQAAGVEAVAVNPASVDARGSTPFWAKAASGLELFVKIVSGEQRDADLLFKTWRFLAFREVEDETPFATPKQQVEHEAYLALLAQRAGVRVPPFVLETHVSDGTSLLVEQRVAGRGLDSLPSEEIDDALLHKLWEQVKLLRAARIAHRDLRRANILVDEQGQPWLIDFGFAEAAASERRLSQDVVELLVSLASVISAERAVVTAVDILGPEAVTNALPLLQPLALSSVTRHELRAHPGLLKEIRHQVSTLTGAEPPPAEPLARVQMRTLVWLAGIAFAIHLLLPQVSEVRHTIEAIRSAHWGWFAPAILGAASAYWMAALALMGAVEYPLALGRTALVQLAGSFINRMTPKGFGGIGLNEHYLERMGIERAVAVTTIALNMTAGVIVHAVSLIVTTALLGRVSVERVHLPKHWPVLVAFVIAMAFLGAALLIWSPIRRRVNLTPILNSGRSLLRLLQHPLQAVKLFAGAAGVTAANALTLAASLRAFGADISLLKVITVYLGGAAISSASPTPGGLGAIEAALVAGLTAVGVQAGPAVAGVLTFRLFTFWLPILPGFLAFRYLQRRQVV